jgi:hypothetical protein
VRVYVHVLAGRCARFAVPVCAFIRERVVRGRTHTRAHAHRCENGERRECIRYIVVVVVLLMVHRRIAFLFLFLSFLFFTYARVTA